MSENGIAWILGAIVVLGLGASSVILGVNLMPTGAVLESKLGTLAPWILTWGMIWITVLTAVALAGFLVATGVRKFRRS